MQRRTIPKARRERPGEAAARRAEARLRPSWREDSRYAAYASASVFFLWIVADLIAVNPQRLTHFRRGIALLYLSPFVQGNVLRLPTALLVAILCGVGTAVLVGRYNRIIRSAEDASYTSGYFPFAVLPRVRDGVSGPHDIAITRFAIEIEGAYRKTGERSFLFCQTDPNEDLSLPISALLDQLATLGLKVRVVPAAQLSPFDGGGRTRRQPSTSAYSFVTQTLNELEANYDLVFIQAAMVLESVDAEYLAKYVGATLLFVSLGGTLRRDLHASILLLERIGAQMQLVVSNAPGASVGPNADAPLSAQKHAASQPLSILSSGPVDSSERLAPKRPALIPQESASAAPAPATSAAVERTVFLQQGRFDHAAAEASAVTRTIEPPDESFFIALEHLDASADTSSNDSAAHAPRDPMERATAAELQDFEEEISLTKRNSIGRWERIPLLRPTDDEWFADDLPASGIDLRESALSDGKAGDARTVGDSETLASLPPGEETKLDRAWGLLSRYRTAPDAKDKGLE